MSYSLQSTTTLLNILLLQDKDFDQYQALESSEIEIFLPGTHPSCSLPDSWPITRVQDWESAIKQTFGEFRLKRMLMDILNDEEVEVVYSLVIREYLKLLPINDLQHMLILVASYPTEVDHDFKWLNEALNTKTVGTIHCAKDYWRQDVNARDSLQHSIVSYQVPQSFIKYSNRHYPEDDPHQTWNSFDDVKDAANYNDYFKSNNVVPSVKMALQFDKTSKIIMSDEQADEKEKGKEKEVKLTPPSNLNLFDKINVANGYATINGVEVREYVAMPYYNIIIAVLESDDFVRMTGSRICYAFSPRASLAISGICVSTIMADKVTDEAKRFFNSHFGIDRVVEMNLYVKTLDLNRMLAMVSRPLEVDEQIGQLNSVIQLVSGRIENTRDHRVLTDQELDEFKPCAQAWVNLKLASSITVDGVGNTTYPCGTKSNRHACVLGAFVMQKDTQLTTDKTTKCTCHLHYDSEGARRLCRLLLHDKTPISAKPHTQIKSRLTTAYAPTPLAQRVVRPKLQGIERSVVKHVTLSRRSRNIQPAVTITNTTVSDVQKTQQSPTEVTVEAPQTTRNEQPSDKQQLEPTSNINARRRIARKLRLEKLSAVAKNDGKCKDDEANRVNDNATTEERNENDENALSIFDEC